MIADLLLVAAMLIVALASMLARQAFTAVALFIAYGLLLTLAWVRLAAVDVAMTEAAIGAGLSGVLLLGAVRRLATQASPPPEQPPGPAMTLLIALGCAALAAALGAVVLLLPNPAPSLAAPVAANLPATDLGNPVTGVLMSFRALDTLLESAVVLLAVVCVWALTPEGGWGGVPGAAQPVQRDGPLALLARALPPLGIVIAMHILWVGADAPGGKFQAAAILAAMWLLPWMAGLVTPPPIAARWLRWTIAIGPVVFIAIGLAGAVIEGAFLAYPPGWAKPLILIIEFILTASIAVALALLVIGTPDTAQRR
ncbi:hydrogenase subunit MbhD domain-containing protein [Neoroseomonas lacus]|uniref:Sodium:proton antiporter n=1 Tax=Neoroseomonas lacus TaxID=287609 RepID=A0A917KGA9_9PROT|nr:hydrogenase subunit MbhD domain-containing protein [Neoroseomonas lacus]GGJ12753.1 sodium:proton antiporter [Neoroseomonas lacus]